MRDSLVMGGHVLNIPNLLTFLRLLLLPWIAYSLSNPDSRTAAILLGVAAATDFLDGYIARRFQLESVLGKLLDPIADKLVLCVALVFLVARPENALSASLASLLLAREFWITGLRAIAAAEGLVIGARASGKYKAALQFGGLAAVAWGGVLNEAGVWALWISCAFSYWSLVRYSKDAYRGLRAKFSPIH